MTQFRWFLERAIGGATRSAPVSSIRRLATQRRHVRMDGRTTDRSSKRPLPRKYGGQFVCSASVLFVFEKVSVILVYLSKCSCFINSTGSLMFHVQICL